MKVQTNDFRECYRCDVSWIFLVITLGMICVKLNIIGSLCFTPTLFLFLLPSLYFLSHFFSCLLTTCIASFEYTFPHVTAYSTTLF